MSTNLLPNGGFEDNWTQGGTHRCVVYPVDGSPPYEKEAGEIFSPPGWTVWYRHGLPVAHDAHNQVGWSQPEVRQAGMIPDSRRVHSGQYGLVLFTFSRIHDTGLFQQVPVPPGTKVRLTAWAHAWSNRWGSEHESDPRWSEGSHVGYRHFFAPEGTAGLDDADRNFTFYVGIDPTGGTNPLADTVVWGRGAHIYNAYAQVPPVEATSTAQTITVFLRSRCLWPFKHNDAYWDDVSLEVVVAPPQVQMAIEPETAQVGQTVQVTVRSWQALEGGELGVSDPDNNAVGVTEVPVTQPTEGKAWRWTFVPRRAGNYHVRFAVSDPAQPLAEATLSVQPAPTWGLPREQYARTYVLLPPGAGREWVQAILDSGAWERNRWTIGGSADDAGIGALEDKTVIAVNPSGWPSDLQAFFQQYYPRTRYVGLVAATPAELRRLLESQ